MITSSIRPVVTLRNTCSAICLSSQRKTCLMISAAAARAANMVASEAPKVSGMLAIAQAIWASSWMSWPMIIHFVYSTWLATLWANSPSSFADSCAALR